MSSKTDYFCDICHHKIEQAINGGGVSVNGSEVSVPLVYRDLSKGPLHFHIRCITPIADQVQKIEEQNDIY